MRVVKQAGNTHNTSTVLEADSLDEYCNSAAIKLSTPRQGNLFETYLITKPKLAEIRDI
jgi:hypothetical protein